MAAATAAPATIPCTIHDLVDEDPEEHEEHIDMSGCRECVARASLAPLTCFGTCINMGDYWSAVMIVIFSEEENTLSFLFIF